MSETIYRGVKIPADERDYDDPENDPYVRGWKDGVDAHYIRIVEGQNAAMESMGLLLTNRVYRGVLVPEGQTAGFYSGWKSGVDEALSLRDKDRDPDNGWTRLLIDESDAPAVRAFLSILTDNPDTARDIIRTMSPKDRAVLSFFLRETGRIVEEEDSLRDAEERRRGRALAEAVRAHEQWVSRVRDND